MIGLIVNPRARRVALDPAIIDRLRALLGGRGCVAITRDADELRAALSAFRAADCETIATCGGDGTNVFVLTEMMRTWRDEPLPRMALLRGGTINIVAENLGIHGAPEAILRRLLQDHPGRPARSAELDTLVVDGRSGFIFAAGLPSRFLSSYYDGRGTGRLRAITLVLRTLGSILVRGPFSRGLLEPVPTEFSVDGSPSRRGSPNVLLATTVANVGLGLRVGYRVGRTPRHFHALAAKAGGRHLWTGLLPALLGRPGSLPSHLDGLATRLDLRFDEEQPCLLDGELFSAARVAVEIGARIRFEIA